MELLGQVVQSPIMLTQDRQEFLYEYCDFTVRFSVYVVLQNISKIFCINPLKNTLGIHTCPHVKLLLEP